MDSSELKINEVLIQSTKIGGRGGKEGLIRGLFHNRLEKVNGELHDFVSGKFRYEIKKQMNQQWFDISKYHNLSDEDKNIILVFVMWNGKTGLCTTIVTITLGKFLNLVLDNENHKCIEYGWTRDNIKILNDIKKVSPKIQAKAQLYMKTFIENYKCNFNVIYNSQ